MKNYFLPLISLSKLAQGITAQENPHQWPEEIDGQKALEFVEKQNKATLAALSAEEDYQDIYNRNLKILHSTEKIAYPTIHGNYA